MDVSKRQVGDVTILDLKGRITIGSGDMQLRFAVQEVMNSGATKVLIDITQLITVFDVYDSEDEGVSSFT